MKHVRIPLAAFTLLTLIACGAPTSNDRPAAVDQASNVSGVEPSSATKVEHKVPPLGPTAEWLVSSRAVYEKHCASCHGANGEGGQMGRIKIPSFKEEKVVSHTDEQLTKDISNGEGSMPSFKKVLTPEQIKDLVRFIRHEFQGVGGETSGR